MRQRFERAAVFPWEAGNMSGRRKEVFIEKVLKKLYAGSSSTQTPAPKVQTRTSPGTSEVQQKDLKKSVSPTTCFRLTDAEKEVSNRQKVYTVSLPPADYAVASPVNKKTSESENTESEEDGDGEDAPLNFKRRRTRKKQRNTTLQCPSELTSGHANTLQGDTHSHMTDSPIMTKNKKRKLKKKRQKEKLKAAGLLLKATSLDFMYQPEDAGNERSYSEDLNKKMNEILDFLQATQEIYFTDSYSKSADVSLESLHEVLELLKIRKMDSSDVESLHQLKSLIVLQDTERINITLENFKQHSSMSTEHCGVVFSLFHYWITDILPVRNRK
ncbi:glutamate-rich protein 1 [Ambystoma mexicanum]|uniref:glutamate-rich protein 1 n=1 Tax=Ambystoma mexicanum TaxID=8296 RepID=UPI0037E74B8D